MASAGSLGKIFAGRSLRDVIKWHYTAPLELFLPSSGGFFRQSGLRPSLTAPIWNISILVRFLSWLPYHRLLNTGITHWHKRGGCRGQIFFSVSTFPWILLNQYFLKAFVSILIEEKKLLIIILLLRLNGPHKRWENWSTTTTIFVPA